MKENAEDDDVAYRLTAKGFLFVETNFDDELWDSLLNFVKKQAVNDGYNPKGIPALVFDKNGGRCVMIEEEQLAGVTER